MYAQDPLKLFNDKLAELQPTGRLASVEKAIGFLLPKYALRREQTRRSLATLRAQGAYSNRARPNALHGQAGETPMRQRERRQLMWNALEIIDNSGLGESITGKFADYTFGRLRYQARTGDKYKNEQYEAIMKDRCGPSLDYSRRHGLRTMMRISTRGCVVKGGSLLRLVREEPDSRLIHVQGIEYDRIGGLYGTRLEVGYADGVGYDPHTGMEKYFSIYNRNHFGGFYQFQENAPVYDNHGRRLCLHLMAPKDFDQYKGETAFKTVIDQIFYVDEIRKYELQALHMAATQSIIYKTKDGNMPRNRYSRQVDPATGLTTNVYRVGGNEVMSMEVGEEATMFEHNRTSPNVIAAWNNTEFEICAALQLPRVFALGKNDGNGVDTRFQGKQGARSIANYWQNAEEKALTPIMEAVLGNEIAHDMSLYDPNWRAGRFIGPEDIRMDAGYDSAADLNELAEGIVTESDLIALRGNDADEVRKQRKAEIAATRVAAFEMAREIKNETGEDISPDWCYAQLKRGQNSSSGNLAAVIAGDKTDPEKDGATSKGVAIGGEDDKPSAPEKYQREIIEIRGARATALAAFMGDARFGDLPEDAKKEARRAFPQASDDARLPKYGMVVSELVHKVDPANYQLAQGRAAKKTRLACREETEARQDGKMILLHNQKIMDGHHFLAHAERGRITNSLNVVDLTPLRFQEVAAPKLDKLVKDASGHEHAKDGKFGTGGSGAAKKPDAKKDKPKDSESKSGEEKKRQEKPAKPAPAQLSEQSKRAKESHVLVDAEVQRYSEEHNEPQFGRAVGGVSLPNGEPVDVIIPANPSHLDHWQKTTEANRGALDAWKSGGKKGPAPKKGDLVGAPGHGVEIKTSAVGKGGRIYMNPYAQVRKINWEKSNKGSVFHTVVIDDHDVYNANGPGQHGDESKRVYYYQRGVAGNRAIKDMHPCKNMDEVKALMNTPEKELPPAAQRTDAGIRQGTWKFINDKNGKRFVNSKTKQIVKPKK